MEKLNTKKNPSLFFIILAAAGLIAVLVSVATREASIPQPDTAAIEELNPDDFDPEELDDLDDNSEQNEVELPSDVENELDSLENALNSLNSEDFDTVGLDR